MYSSYIVFSQSVRTNVPVPLPRWEIGSFVPRWAEKQATSFFVLGLWLRLTWRRCRGLGAMIESSSFEPCRGALRNGRIQKQVLFTLVVCQCESGT